MKKELTYENGTINCQMASDQYLKEMVWSLDNKLDWQSIWDQRVFINLVQYHVF